MQRFIFSRISLFVIVALLLVFNVIGIASHWYTPTSHFDTLMHFLGGAWSAMFFLQVLHQVKLRPFARFLDQPFLAILSIVSFAALVGILWEFFEFSVDTFIVLPYGSERIQLGLVDTLSDIFFDLVGSFTLAALYVSSRRLQ